MGGTSTTHPGMGHIAPGVHFSSRLTVVSSQRESAGSGRTAHIAPASHLGSLETSSPTPPAVPISFTIEPSTGLLRTVVTGRVGREEMAAYANELRAHPDIDRIQRRLVDVRPSAVVTADELLDLLLLEHDVAGGGRRTDRRAILLNSETGPALGRELVVSNRRTSSNPVAYRVFRSTATAYRYLRVEPRSFSERNRRQAAS
jgi:hypothetical protein